LRLRALPPEEHAQQRDVAEDRDFVLARRRPVAHQPADHHRLLIANDDLGLGDALADRDDAEGALGRLRLGDLFLDLHPDLARVVDVRRDADGRADVLALDASEAAEPSEAAETGQPGEARDVLALARLTGQAGQVADPAGDAGG